MESHQNLQRSVEVFSHRAEDITSTQSSTPSSPGDADFPSPAFTDTLSADWAPCGIVRKSQTHDCVADMGGSGQMVSSVSLSRLGGSIAGCRGNREIIDYRNLTPQVPFVPSIAKSLPKKRVSLRRSRRAVRDGFVLRRQKQEGVALPGLLPQTVVRSLECSTTCLLSDSTTELSGNLCDEVASMKSFSSLMGCGEVYAEEEPQTGQKRNPNKNKEKDPFQGGVEQMASPVHAEILELLRMWDSRVESILIGTPTLTQVDCQQPDDLAKNDNPELVSTSDEGYYDSLSPALEEVEETSSTPGYFPRDSYSGDALYELFYDPDKSGLTPSLSDESILGPASDLPLSMYSFHVGAEENLAPPLAVDFVGQELLQSNWKGKECLLKLCDTEISMAMGIINWLKQKTERSGSLPEEAGGERSFTLSDSAHLSSKEKEGTQQDTKHHSRQCLDITSPGEQQIKSPSSGSFFRIFNKDSPLTPSRVPSSPLGSSLGSTVYLLAVNRELLCEVCKRLLMRSSTELYLCTSCMSLVEHISTADIPSPAQPPTPPSSCTPRGDQSVVGLVEQVSYLKIGEQGEGQKGGVMEHEQSTPQHQDAPSPAQSGGVGLVEHLLAPNCSGTPRPNSLPLPTCSEFTGGHSYATTPGEFRKRRRRRKSASSGYVVLEEKMVRRHRMKK